MWLEMGKLLHECVYVRKGKSDFEPKLMYVEPEIYVCLFLWLTNIHIMVELLFMLLFDYD